MYLEEINSPIDLKKLTTEEFIAAIKESSQNSQLTSISFGLTKVSIKDLDLIGDIIANGNIKCPHISLPKM